MRSFFALAVSAMLAGRVAADLSINITTTLKELPASQFLAIADGPLKSGCVDSCQPPQSAIEACAGDAPCLCKNETISLITPCEQCYFDALIRDNKPMPDPRAGSTPAMGAYVEACKLALNITKADDPMTPVFGALALPKNWVGPTNIELGLPATIATVGFGGLLAVGALAIFANL